MSLAVRHEIVGPPAAPHCLRIAHLSDLHLWFSDRKLREIERRLDRWQPNVVALTGDYADTPWGRRLALEWFGRLAATYTVCWVAGNHDRWPNDQFLRDLTLLSRAHPIDQRDAWIADRCGRQYRFTTLGRMAASLAHRDVGGYPTVVLLHNPAEIEPAKLCGAEDCLLLAGHLHGGQINLWRDRAGRPQPASSCYRWLADRTTIGSAALIVSRGLGDTLPVRIGAPKEIVMIDFWAPVARPEAQPPERTTWTSALAAR